MKIRIEREGNQVKNPWFIFKKKEQKTKTKLTDYNCFPS